MQWGDPERAGFLSLPGADERPQERIFKVENPAQLFIRYHIPDNPHIGVRKTRAEPDDGDVSQRRSMV